MPQELPSDVSTKSQASREGGQPLLLLSTISMGWWLPRYSWTRFQYERRSNQSVCRNLALLHGTDPHRRSSTWRPLRNPIRCFDQAVPRAAESLPSTGRLNRRGAQMNFLTFRLVSNHERFLVHTAI